MSSPPPASPNIQIVAHNVVHLRAEPKTGSELVSQTLLGRAVSVLRTEGGWSHIETDDTYRGWAESRWLAPPDGRVLTPITAIFSELRESPAPHAPLTARLPILNGVFVEDEATAPGFASVALSGSLMRGFLPTVDLAELPIIPIDRIPACAAERGRDFRGTPYLWGGSSSYGLDCSGFVQICYRLAGLILRRDADIQRDDPRFVPVAQSEMRPGDLVFFGKPDKITHVGMFLESGYFIHSAGGAGVIVTPVDDDRYWPGFVDARRLDPVRAGDSVVRVEAENR